jgi:hypothetical protein
MTRHTTWGNDSVRPGSLTVAAWFVAEQLDGIARIDERHTSRADGSCAGCGTHQPVPWPCVLVYIGQLAKQLRVESMTGAAEITTRPDSAAPNPAAATHATPAAA